MDADILNQLARIGHQVWSERMRVAGWSYGVKYSEANLTHDALVAFDKLPEIDRRTTVLKIEAEQLVARLGVLATPDRSDTRPFCAEELRVGRAVCWAGEGDQPAEPGSVQSWEIDEDTGDVVSITVTWKDGSVQSVGALEGLLRRVED